MTTHVHIVTNSFPPLPGGMEKSVERIALFLSHIEDFNVHLYIRNVENPVDISHSKLTMHNLLPLKKQLLEPYEEIPQDYNTLKWKEKEIHRIEFLSLSNAVSKVKNPFPLDSHVLVSFYLSSTGVFCQHVATHLGIPHMVSLRGWDFCRDFYGLYGHGAIHFVLTHANHIITTNNEQKTNLIKLYGNPHRFSTLYNPIESLFLTKKWSPPSGEKISLFTDTGFLYGNGSHILLKSFDTLKQKGYPITLFIVGKTDTINTSYWNNLKKTYKTRYPDAFFFDAYVKPSVLHHHLLNSHLYLSATLGEGCSNSRLQALATGIPMITTLCAEMKDLFSHTCPAHIELTQPGDIDGFTKGLEKKIEETINGQFQHTPDQNINFQSHFSKNYEIQKWESLCRQIAHFPKS